MMMITGSMITMNSWIRVRDLVVSWQGCVVLVRVAVEGLCSGTSEPIRICVPEKRKRYVSLG